MECQNITSRYDDWEDKTRDICAQVALHLGRFKPYYFQYEMPAFMIQAAKQNKRGDIMKLAILAGAICGTALPVCHTVNSVPIINWKGQVKKELMNDRVKAKMSQLGYSLPELTTHELDAIGIGLYTLGLMK